MQTEQRVHAFVELGKKLARLSAQEIEQVATRAYAHNNWFTPANVALALQGVAHLLEENALRRWLSAYGLGLNAAPPKQIGVVMAGNIPLVGAHDMICVLLSGHILQAKPSSQDPVLPRQLAQWLIEIEPAFAPFIRWVERLERPDAIIATGSDNSARYFDYYFGKYPNLIRRNRVSVALLHGHESAEQLAAIGQDILQYFGLGCRNVAKLLVPTDYDFTPFFQAIEAQKEVIQHHKYLNNYEYNKSIYLVNRVPHLDNGFLLLKEDSALVSPISVVFSHHYQSADEAATLLTAQADKIQCLVCDVAHWQGTANAQAPQSELWKRMVNFGEAQCPGIADYADGEDTMRFLCSL